MTKSYNIAVIGGDGTGPEVTREAVKVLNAAAKKMKGSTPAAADSSSKALPTKSPSRKVSTPVAGSSAACVLPSSSPASAIKKKNLLSAGKQTSLLTPLIFGNVPSTKSAKRI